MRRFFSLVLAACVASTPLAASAQSAGADAPAPASPSGSAAAEALFQQGRALLAEGKTAEACERFAGSQRLEAKLGTLLNLALCHETLGLHATAWAEFTSAATIAGRDGQAERQAFAREHIATLQAKLSTLTVQLATPSPGASVTLDGQPFPAIGSPLPVDPGKHEVAVAAPGKQTWRRTVEVKSDRQAHEVVVPALTDEGAAPAPPSVPASAPTQPAAEEGGGGVPPVAIVAFSISGAALIVGAATGIVTLGMTGDIKETCDGDVCPADQESDIDSAEKTANVSNASFLIALVGAGVGIGAILLADDGPKKKSATTKVEPMIGLGSLGARGRF
jgi:hypothetical protein